MTSILKADTIQDTDGNNIINENSNTITIGASGDTTNIIGTLQNNGAAVGGANTPAFHVYLSGNQSISSSTAVKVNFDSETFDTDNAFASNKFTVPTGEGGKYFFHAHIRKGTNNDNLNLVYIYVNGNSKGYFRRQAKAQNAYQITQILDLSAGDYVEVYVYDDGGSASILANADNYTYFTGYKLIT
jgi:hypothetical protein